MSNKKYTGVDWEEVRQLMEDSPMVNIKISSLAENVGMSWPYSGADETPAKYVGMSWRMLTEHPTFVNRPERIQTLIDIFKETMAFDNPLVDMVEQTEKAASQENEYNRVLNKLEIDGKYPVEMSNLERETKEFCTREKIHTIAEFIEATQRIAKNIIIGGDYRTFLNAVANADEAGIGKYLPFRKGAKGLHLEEAIGLGIDRLSQPQRLALMKRFGGKMTSAQEVDADKVKPADVEHMLQEIESFILKLKPLFEGQWKVLSEKHHKGEALDRDFVPLNDPVKEFVAIRTFLAVIDPKSKEASKGLFSAFSKWFKK